MQNLPMHRQTNGSCASPLSGRRCKLAFDATVKNGRPTEIKDCVVRPGDTTRGSDPKN